MRREKLRSPENIKPIEKLFIAQRGEIAFRAAQVCAERGIAAVIPDTFSDTNPLASKLVEANLDRGWELAHLGGVSQEENFTNPKVLLQTMKLHDCDAVFLGYGFLSESDEFVKQCEEAGIRTLTPPSSVMARTGNKISAREIAKKIKIGRIAHMPILEGTGDLKNLEQAVGSAKGLGFPVMLKDPDLGGGMGNVVVRNEGELETAYLTLKGKPENRELFIERFVQNPVHVEVQIVGDKFGNVVSLGERDCTMQRKAQKVIEESPSPHISERLRGVLQIAAVNLAKAVKYSGVGTVEFIIDKDRKGKEGDPAWYFMEVNPRIQVEHPVTEQQTGIDMIGLMVDIAEGRPLPFNQEDINPSGHSMEARVYAENADRNFEKSSGEVTTLRYPEIEGVRVDPALREGDCLSEWYDNTLFKAIASGVDRESARTKLVEFLSETTILGVSSNVNFLRELLETEEFKQGRGTTNFVEQWWQKRLRDRVHAVSEFINGGVFTEYPSSMEYNPSLLPQSATVVSRKDGSEITYADHLAKLQKEKGTLCAAKYGIQERDGVRWVLYTLDYSINAGTLGPQEGNIFVDACKLAHEQGTPLVTLVSTGGVDNWTNTLGLHQMRRTVAAATQKYPPKLHLNINHGMVLGGVPASFAGTADIRIIVDSEESKTGLTGIFMVAKGLGINFPENTKAKQVYQALADSDDRYQGLHSPNSHYRDRTADILVGSLGEASDKVTHLIHTLRIQESIVDPNCVFQPREQIMLREGSSQASRFDRLGGLFPVWFSHRSSFRDRLVGMLQEVTGRGHKPFANFERLGIINEVYRPTAADLIDPRLGMVDDAVLLSGQVQHFGRDELYPSIIAAVVRIDTERFLVIAQQTSRVWDEVSGKFIKKYIAQQPKDWEYFEHILEGVGEKNKLPVFYAVDTLGADALPESESRGQSNKIAHTLRITNLYRFPSMAFLLGLGGSGGCEAMFGPMDVAFAAENFLAFVSDPVVKSWIQGGYWLDDKSEAFRRFIDGEVTARAEVMRGMGLIDYIIEEGPGGAHKNPRLFALNLRKQLLSSLRELKSLPERELLDRRWERNQRSAILFSAR